MTIEMQRQMTVANAPTDVLRREIARRMVEQGIRTGPKPTCQCGECAKCRTRDRVRATRERQAVRMLGNAV